MSQEFVDSPQKPGQTLEGAARAGPDAQVKLAYEPPSLTPVGNLFYLLGKSGHTVDNSIGHLPGQKKAP
jgi:hypothetical protein